MNIDVIVDSAHNIDIVLDQFEWYDKRVEEFYESENSFNLFGLFQVNLDNYIKVKFAFMYHMQIPPEQIDNWPYWEYEEYVELLTDVMKKKQQNEKEQHSQQSSMDPSKDASKYMSKMKMPNMPKFK